MTDITRGARGWPARQSFTVRRWPLAVIYTACVLIMLLVVALQSYQFARRVNYRDDEIRTVHAGMTMTIPQVVQWMSVDIHPPLWRVSATVWVSFFGPDEHITRFLSTLYTLLGLAFFYRLARDLFDVPTALFAVFLLGLHALFFYYTHELRPYAALVLFTTASHLFFLRWLRRPGFRNALFYVAATTAALYTHFFALYVVFAQLVALFLLVRWGGRQMVRALSLPALAGLAFVGWLPSFLYSFLVANPGGVEYGIIEELRTPSYIYGFLQMRPLPLGNLLVGLGVLIPGTAMASMSRIIDSDSPLFRIRGWRKGYLLIVTLAIFLGALVTTHWIDVLTQRNLIVMIPVLMLLAALGLRALPWQAALIVTVLVLNSSVTEFINYQRPEPYLQAWRFVAQDYQAHDPVIISIDHSLGRYFAFAYYLMDRMPDRINQHDMFYLSLGDPAANLPEPPLNHTVDDSPAALLRFHTLIDSAQRVFWIDSPSAEPSYTKTYRDVLLSEFNLLKSGKFDRTSDTNGGYVFEEYVRR